MSKRDFCSKRDCVDGVESECFIFITLKVVVPSSLDNV